MPYKIIKKGEKYQVVKKEGGRVMGTHDSEEKAKKQIAALHANVKESFDLVWEVQDIKLNKVEEESGRWLAIEGTALAMGKSKNGRVYTYDNLKENDGSSFNWIVGHRADYDNPDHNVGEGTYGLSENTLRFTSKIKNTKAHPDIIEQVSDGLVAPSIQGGAKNITERENDAGETEYLVEGLHIPIIALVNKHARGVEAASIEVAIAEAYDKSGNADEDDEMKDGKKVKKNKTSEVNSMAEEIKEVEKLKGALAEKDKKIAKFEQEKKDRLVAEKEALVEKILQANDKLDRKQLMEKTNSELKIIESYEVKEQDEGSKEGEGEEKEGEEGEKQEGAGAGETETGKEGEPSEPPKESKELRGIIVEKDTRFIGMNSDLYNKFNKDVKESVYR